MSDILISVEGKVGRIRLNRPKALHALDEAMCVAMLTALQQWATDPSVHAILLDHAEGRGFCAGGDIRMLATSGAQDGREAVSFFRTEYQLNHLLFTYPKPVVAVMDGITMGGGVGISQPAQFRIATENTRFAMPETGIGLFTDVGGGWYLSRLNGRLGRYLAVTGHRLDGGECRAVGLSTHYLNASEVEAAKTRILAAPDNIAAILEALATASPAAPILDHLDDIDRLFASDRLEDIIAALEADGGDWAKQQLATIAGKSPLAMKVCLRLLELSASLQTFEQEMRLEFAIANRMVRQADFIEGVRALIIDKDQNPVWAPATVEAVSQALVDEILSPLPAEAAWEPAKENA